MTSAAPLVSDRGRRLVVLSLALLGVWSVGLFARNFWTPDEPREADLSWRMSVQADKAVPLLAGIPFCEKPPLTYWMAGGAIALLGLHPWAARLPNLLYALLGTLAMAALARRALGARAAPVAAAVMATFLLTYQVTIWLATDAPLLACDTLAMLGLWIGYHAETSRERLGGYGLMHAALALGFLSKSAAAWVVPALTLLTLCIWERRWRELGRLELYAPLALQALVIVPWVWAVYRAPDGAAHLKVFFWNNLAGRFVHLDAPAALEYTSGHRNTPGKYLLELPMYLFPWTLLAVAAARRAWQLRRAPRRDLRAVRFALASTVPAILLLSLAATARNIYLAPVLPGCALFIAWWWQGLPVHADGGDERLAFATGVLLAVALLGFAAAALVVTTGPGLIAALLGVAATAAVLARAMRAPLEGALAAMLLGWCVLLVIPAAPLYGEVNHWQALERVGRAVAADTMGRPLILLAPDETTLAFMDLYGRDGPDVQPVGDAGTLAPRFFEVIDPPLDATALQRVDAALTREPGARVLAQLAGRALTPKLGALSQRLHRRDLDEGAPLWAADPHLEVRARYALPNGRRYALLGSHDEQDGTARGASIR